MTASLATVDQPGVYDMPDAVYFADPVPGGSLSASGAKLLLPPNCPATFHHRRLHPEPHKTAYDLGHAAHLQVLGIGPKVTVVDADDWRTKAAKEQKAAAYTEGAVPLLRAQYEDVRAMADALATHPLAGQLLHPGHGEPEKSLFWIDTPIGVWRRARLDWIHQRNGGRRILVDYKTTTSAHPDALSKTVYNYAYHAQGAWYLDGAQALDLAGDDAVFCLVFQEKVAPYLVNVVQLDPPALRAGRARNRQALEIYRDCTESGIWPGYSDTVEYVSLPAWAEHREDTW